MKTNEDILIQCLGDAISCLGRIMLNDAISSEIDRVRDALKTINDIEKRLWHIGVTLPNDAKNDER